MFIVLFLLRHFLYLFFNSSFILFWYLFSYNSAIIKCHTIVMWPHLNLYSNALSIYLLMYCCLPACAFVHIAVLYNHLYLSSFPCSLVICLLLSTEEGPTPGTSEFYCFNTLYWLFNRLSYLFIYEIFIVPNY